MNQLITYEEFKADWLKNVTEVTMDGMKMSESVIEYFIECDYKRYTGEWSKDEL